MSRSQTHDWNKGRVVLDRRASDGDKPQPPPSYYGPNFQNVEQRRSSSLAGGDIRHPVAPDRYGKRPQPYPSKVAEEYNQYKQYDRQYAEAKARTAQNPALLKTPVNDHRYRQNIEMARDLSHGSRVAANTAAAVRSGFAHKYPYAYDGQSGVQGHKETVNNLRKGAKKAAKAEQKASELLARRR